MVDASNYGSTGSNESENKDDSDDTSTSHLYIVEDGDPNARGAGMNHHPTAYDKFRSGGEMYNAFTKKGSGRRNEWSVSDTLSHIAMSYVPLAEVFGSNPEAYAELSSAVMNATAEALKGDVAPLMNFTEPDESDIVDYIARSDDVEFDDLVGEIKDRQSDSDDSE